MKSVANMIQQLDGMTGTNDLSRWEQEFVASVFKQSREGKETTRLTSKQIEIIERLYTKHFGD
jgi:hypothetical protein